MMDFTRTSLSGQRGHSFVKESRNSGIIAKLVILISCSITFAPQLKGNAGSPFFSKTAWSSVRVIIKTLSSSLTIENMLSCSVYRSQFAAAEAFPGKVFKVTIFHLVNCYKASFNSFST